MKQFSTYFKWLVMSLLLCIGSSAWAEDFEFSLNGLYQNGSLVTAKTVINTSGGTLTFTDKNENFTILLTRNSGNQPGFYTSSGYFRFYTNDTFKLSAADGITITKVVITSYGSSFSLNTLEGLNASTKTWTGSASEVTFTGAGTNKWDKLTITYSTSGGSSTAVATTTTIDATGITNSDVYAGTAAGSLSATVKDNNNDAVSGATVTWSGNNDAVATIDASTGAVTLVAAGTVTFTASYAGVENQYAASYDTYEMTVTDSTPFTGGDVTFDATKDTGTSPLTKNGVTFTCDNGVLNNGSEYRLYKNSNTTFSVPNGYLITSIAFTGASGYPASGFSTQTGWTTDGDNGTWTGSETSVSFTASGAQVRATKIVVTVEVGTPKPDPELSFSSATAEASVGQQFTPPTLNTAIGFNGTVEYSSSVETVAQVMDTETGELRIVGGGTTVITATFAGNDDFKAGSASYTLTVTDNRTATTVTQDNIVLDVADIATLTRLAPVVKDADDNEITYSYDAWPTEMSFEIVSDDNGLIGSIDNNTGEITLNSVTGTATLKAFYNLYNVNSTYKPSECTFTITVESTLNGIAEFCTLTNGSTGTVRLTDAVVLYVKGNDMFVRDNTGAIDFYKTELSYEAGNVLNGKITAKYTLYSGMPELTTPISNNTLVATTGSAVTPTEITTSDAADNACNLVKLSGVTVTTSDNKFYVDNVQVYDKFKLNYTIEAGKTYNIVGIMIPYNSTYEICPTEAPTEVVVVTPSITLEQYTYNVDANGGDNELPVTCTNLSTTPQLAVVFCESDGTTPATYDHSWITAEINANGNIAGHIDVNTGDARTAYFKVSGVDADNNTVYSELITINQAAPAAPSIVFNPSSIDFEADGGGKTIGGDYFSCNNFSSTPSLEILFYESDGETSATYDWITANFNNEGKIDISYDANTGAARSAYLKIHAVGTTVYSNLFTVNQAAYVVDYATLPFEFDGGKSDIASKSGLTQEGLGSDYSSKPYLKFDGTGDNLILKINERPGILTFDIKGNPSNSVWSGTFKVQTSEDGATYTDLATYDDLTSAVQNESFDNLGENVRYIKWIYTEKVSGNVALGNITLAKAQEPTAPVWSTLPTPTISVGEVYELNLNQYVTGYPTPTISITTGGDIASIDANNCFHFTPTAEGYKEFVFFASNSEGGMEGLLAVTITAAAPSVEVSETTINAPSDYSEGTINVTYNNITDILSDVVYYEADGTTETTASAYGWLQAGINNSTNNVDYTIDQNTNTDARTAYIKVYAIGNEGEAYSDLITITQAGYVAPGTGDNYVKVTSTSDLTVGDQYLIVYEATPVAMGTIGTYGASVDVTIENGTISITDEDVVPVTLGGAEDAYTFATANGDFLSWTSGNTLNLTDDATVASAQWAISFNEGDAIICNASDNSRELQYNTGSPRFACYTGSQKPVQLYKKEGTNPSITITPSSIDAKAEDTGGVLIVKCKNLAGTPNLQILFVDADGVTPATYDWISGVFNTDGNIQGTLQPNTSDKARTAYLKVSGLAADNTTTVYSNVVTITQQAPVEPYIAMSESSINFDAAGGEKTLSYEYESLGSNPTFAVQFFEADGVTETGCGWVSYQFASNDNKVTITGQNNDENSARTAFFRVYAEVNKTKIYSNLVTVTQDAPVPATTYTLANNITSGKRYIIVGENKGEYQAMGSQNNNNRGAVSVTYDNGVVSVAGDAANKPVEFVIYGPDASGNYTIYDADQGYLYAASSGSNYLKSQATNDMNGKWSISIDDTDGEATVVAQGSNTRKYMRFNSTLFSCYDETSTVTDLVYFYEKDGDTPVATTISKKLNGSGYSTYATKNVLDFLDAEDASYSAWQITEVSGTTITFSQITTTVKPGTGILLKGTANADIDLNILPAGGADLSNSNKLVGFPSETQINAGEYYGLSGDKFVRVDAGTIPEGKALLPANLISTTAKTLNFVFEDETTGISTMETIMVDNDAWYDLTGRKVAQPTEGIFIHNGKKVFIK